jgi:hypothetical protein
LRRNALQLLRYSCAFAILSSYILPRIDLIISKVSEPSEALQLLLSRLKGLEHIDLPERCDPVKKKLIEILRVARHFAKREESSAKFFTC